MEPQVAKTTPVTRVVTVLGIASLIGMIGYVKSYPEAFVR